MNSRYVDGKRENEVAYKNQYLKGGDGNYHKIWQTRYKHTEKTKAFFINPGCYMCHSNQS